MTVFLVSWVNRLGDKTVFQIFKTNEAAEAFREKHWQACQLVQFSPAEFPIVTEMEVGELV